MTFRIAVGAMGILALGVAIWAENSPGKADPGPRYDTRTVVAFEAVVSEVRTKESVPAGVSLLVKNDSDAAWTVYLGPADFVKGFDLTFKKGDRIHVTGSKLKLGDDVLVLAREVRKEAATLYLRGKEGEPYW
jgi:predicted TIM-barrel enzyme